MTISTTVTSIQFDGNDSTLDFEFPAKVFDESDLLVQLYTDGVWQTLTFPAQYTVSIDLDGIATVTPTQVVAAGEILDIRSNIELLQPTDIKTLGRFLPEIHENVFDRLLRQIQDLSRKVSASVRYPDNESADGEAPVIASRSGRYLFANALTGAFEWVTSIATTALSQSIWNQYQADSDPYKRTAAEIAAGVTPDDKSRLELNVLRYGADPTGATDSWPAFMNAIAVAEKVVNEDSLNNLMGGAQIDIPEGFYKISQPIIWTKRGINFVGRGRGTVIFADTGFTANRAIFQSRETSDRSASGTSITFVIRDLSLFGADPRTNDFQSPYTSTVRGAWLTGIDGVSGAGCGFDNVYFRGFGINIMMAGAWSFSILNCGIMGARDGNQVGTGISFADATQVDAEEYSAGSGSYAVNIPVIQNCHFEYLARAFQWSIGSGGWFAGNRIEKCTSTSGAIRLLDVKGAGFRGNYHESITGSVYVLGGTSTTLDRCSFADNFFTTRTSGTNTSDFFLQNLTNCLIRDNKHTGSSPGSDVLTASSSFTCTGNIIRYKTLDESGSTIDRDLNDVRDSDEPITSYTQQAIFSPTRLINANETLIRADAGKTLRHTSSSAHAWTIPPGADVAIPNDTVIKGENEGSGVVTVTRGSGVALNRLTGSAFTDANVAVAQGGHFEMRKISANSWNIKGQGLS